jgi:hypothetical protein
MSCDWQCPNPASFQGSCDQTANFSLAAASIRLTPISNVLWIRADSGVSRNRASIRVAVDANAFISSNFPSTSPAASCGARRPFWLHSCNLDVECLNRKSTLMSKAKAQVSNAQSKALVSTSRLQVSNAQSKVHVSTSNAKTTQQCHTPATTIQKHLIKAHRQTSTLTYQRLKLATPKLATHNKRLKSSQHIKRQPTKMLIENLPRTCQSYCQKVALLPAPAISVSRKCVGYIFLHGMGSRQPTQISIATHPQ